MIFEIKKDKLVLNLSSKNLIEYAIKQQKKYKDFSLKINCLDNAIFYLVINGYSVQLIEPTNKK